tara:strand:+ start:75 stop:692 length:618 start_codon:yes stop_codon:yes gene_type:complete
MSQLKVLSPFGPKIARLKFPQLVIKNINLEVERIIKQKKLIEKYDYSKNLVGQVKQEIQLPSSFIKKNIYRYISSTIKKYVKLSTGKLTKKVKIVNFWIVRQYAHEYNPVHFHDGHVSGVGYLKLPKQLNKDKKKLKTNGSIDFINGSKMFLNNSIFNHNPKVGDVILFPNYLMHTAYPFSVEGERRSFSFNVEIDTNIANVFHK